MKNKGFTLVELLGVIVILAIIAAVSIPAVTGIIKSNKEKAYNSQIDIIISAAKNWSINNSNEIKEDEELYVDVALLESKGFIEQDELINPIDNSVITGCVKISYTAEYNQYIYEYQSVCQ